MKKPLVCLLLVALLALALAVPAMADETDPVRLEATVETYEVSGTVYLDLNGNSITDTLTVKAGGKLYLFDSKTSDYDVEDDDYGKVAKIAVEEGGEHVRDFVLPASFGLGRHRYVTIQETGGAYSAHRFYVGIGQFSLYPKYNGSLVLRSMYLGDSVLTRYVEEYGVLSDLGAKGTIAPDTVPDTKDVFAYTAGTTDAQKQNHLIVRIYDVLNAEHKADWAEYTMDKYINAQSYIKLTDGTELTSSVVGMSFQEAVLAAQAQIDGMTVAKVKSNAANITALTNMYQQVITAEEGALLTDWSTPTTRIPYYCLCGASVNGGEHALGCKEGCEEKPFLWTPYDGGDFQSKGNAGYTGANIYLTEDVSKTDSIKLNWNWSNNATESDDLFSDIIIRIDMNGHNITSTNRAFQIMTKSNLWLTNTDPVENSGVISGAYGTTDSAKTDPHSSVIQINKSTLNMLDGVTMQHTGDKFVTYGGVINLGANTVFNMYGGTIKDGRATAGGEANARGGNVNIDATAEMNMFGGVIDNGDAARGGNVYVVAGGKLQMSGDAVIQNGKRTVGAANAGANVYLAGATKDGTPGLLMSGNAEITGGNAWYNGATGGNGGNIWMGTSSYLKMTDTAHITNGRSHSNGGNVNNAGGTIEMHDDSYFAGGLSSISSATAAGTANTRNSSVWLISNGKLKAYGGSADAVGIYPTSKDSSIEVKGSPVLPNVHVTGTVSGKAADSTVRPQVIGALTLDAIVRVVDVSEGKLATFTTAVTEADQAFSASRIQSKNAVPGVLDAANQGTIIPATKVMHCECGAAVGDMDPATVKHTYGCGENILEWTAYVSGSAQKTGNYYLTKNMTGQTQQMLATDTTVRIDLNGYNIVSTSRAFGMNAANETLWLCNTAPAFEGTGIVSGKGDNSHSGVIMMNPYANTVFNMIGNVTLKLADEANVVTQGGVMQVGAQCAFNMYGGTIMNGRSSDNHGGNIFNSGTIKLYNDSKIINGQALTTFQGGNIYSNGKIYIYDDAEISGGKCANGDATHVTADIFNVNGDIVMEGGKIGYVANTCSSASDLPTFSVKNDVQVKAARFGVVGNVTTCPVLTVAGDITGAEIGVSRYQAGVVIPKGTMSTEQWAACRAYMDVLTSYNGDHVLTYEADGIYLRAAKDSSGNQILYHCLCGSKTAEHLGDCDGFDKAWNPVTGNALPKTTGYWYISDASKTYTSAYVTAAADIKLDLNGKTVNMAEKNRAFRFEGSVEGYNAKLTITDSVGNGTIKSGAANGDQAILLWGYRPMLDLNEDTVKETPTKVTISFDLYGGHLDASAHAGTTTYATAGAIELGANATINMYGGKVTGMKQVTGTNSAKGGAFYLSTGTTMTMSGDAQIVGSKVSYRGGSIYMTGSTLTMNGNAKIMNGSVVNTDASVKTNGGNIYADGSSTIIMNGNAQITGGLNDAAMTNSHGGSIYLVAGSSLTLNDNAKITGGNAKNGQGGNIAVYGTLTVNDNAEISGGSSSGNAKSVHADIVCINGIMNFNGGKTGYVHLTQNGATGAYQFNVQGDPEITAVSMSFYSETTVANPPFPSITVTEPLEGASIGISTNIGADKAIIKKGEMTAEAWAAYLEYAKQFHYNATNRTIVYESDGIWVRSAQDAQGNPIYTCLPLGCKNGEHVEGCTAALNWEPLTSEILVNNRITRSGNYYLTEDITPSSQISIGNTNTANSELVVLLDLNGYNINGSWRALQIWNDAELTLLNTSSHPEGASPRHADGGGVITTKARADETWSILQMVAGGSYGVPNTSPTVNMHSGVTLKNPGTIIAANGGGVAVSGNGTFNMYGGTVIGGSVDETKGSGCAFYVTAGSTLNVFGGEIVGATASKGGAIYNLDGIVNLNNVTVSGGSAAMGGAIYNTGSLSLNNVTLSGSSAEQGAAIYSTQDIYLNGTVTLSGDIAMTATKLEFGNRLKITNAIDVDMNLLEGPVTYGADASPNVGKLTVRGEATVLRNGKLCKRPTATSADQLLVGFGAASLNPTQQQLDYSANGYKESYNAETKELSGYYPLAIQGYGYNPAGKVIATQNGTTYAGLDLQATAIAYSDYDGDVIVMISVDSTSVNNSDTMRKEVAAYIGVPAENVMISATHAHSTPAARNVKTFYDASGNTYTLSETYYETFLKGVKAAAKAAVEDRSAVKNLYTATVANVNDLNSGVNSSQNMFNQVRNYVAYKKTFSFSSWSYVTEKLGMATPNHYEYENTSDAHWLEPESEVDDNLQLVKYVREEGTDIVIANFQCHPILFGTGGSGSAGIIHSDVVGSFRYQLSNTLGANVAYFSGAGGNVNSQPDTLMSTDGGTTKATKYAGSLAGCESWGKHLANIVNSKLGSFEQCTGYDKDVAVDKTVVHYNKMVDTELDDCNYSLALRREMAIRIMNKGVANLTDSSYSITTSCPDASMCTGTCTHAEGTCPAKVCTHGTSCPFNGKTYSGWQIRRDWKIYSYYHASTGLYNRRNNVDGQTAPMTLFAYAAGPIAFAAAPYEMFDTNGLEIKTGTLGNNDYTDLGLAQKENPFVMTIVATKTSVESSETSGYVPSRIGYANGGYSTDISPYAAGTGELLVTEFLTMLNGLKND